MNCAYHSQNVAVVQCNGCGKPLCPTCDHRIKGFPYCQDCIVQGVDLLRNQSNSKNYAPFVKKRTSPLVAALLSMLCPGLGAAYNGQTVKALVYFAVFVGLFQMAVLTGGTALFVFGFIGMWFFAALDAWRTAQMIRNDLRCGSYGLGLWTGVRAPSQRNRQAETPRPSNRFDRPACATLRPRADRDSHPGNRTTTWAKARPRQPADVPRGRRQERAFGLPGCDTAEVAGAGHASAADRCRPRAADRHGSGAWLWQ